MENDKLVDETVRQFNFLVEYDVSKCGQLDESVYVRTANTIIGIVPNIDPSDVEEINNYIKESFDDSKMEKYRWHHRGIIRNKFNKLKYGW